MSLALSPASCTPIKILIGALAARCESAEACPRMPMNLFPITFARKWTARSYSTAITIDMCITNRYYTSSLNRSSMPLYPVWSFSALTPLTRRHPTWQHTAFTCCNPQPQGVDSSIEAASNRWSCNDCVVGCPNKSMGSASPSRPPLLTNPYYWQNSRTVMGHNP